MLAAGRPGGGKLRARLSKREAVWADDLVAVMLDTFHDRQRAYVFGVNPLGIQTDSRFASGQEDFSVDIVWYSAGRLDPAREFARVEQ